jgi:zinc transport system substrate-binding protein
MKPKWRIILPFFLISILLSNSGMAADKVPVFVSIVPQKFFVQQIGKDLVDVQVMVLPGASPATYEPKPKQMAHLSKTKIYFAIGVPFENAWLKEIAATNSSMQVIHTDHDIEKLAMAAHHHHDEDEHHEGEADHDKKDAHVEDEHDEDHHDHDGLDPHIWLSPSLVKIQAKTILSALQEVDPANRSSYENNYKIFIEQIDQLDANLNKIFDGKEGLKFMVFHPSWGYFANEYGLKQVPIEVEGKDPKPAQLKELIKHAREEGIKVVFVQPQFSTKSAKVVAREIGGQVTFADPLAEDWLDNLQQVADKFQTVLK